MTDHLPVLREALIHAETHRAGLRNLKEQLHAIHHGGAIAMDAVDGVEALISRLRFYIDELGERQRREAALDAELRSLGIDPDELDDEDPDADEPMGPVIYTYDMILPRYTLPPWEAFRHPISPLRSHYAPTLPTGCYDASFGRVHVRPGCRC